MEHRTGFAGNQHLFHVERRVAGMAEVFHVEHKDKPFHVKHA